MKKLEFLPEGALWEPENRTLIVADMHLEKGASLGLPPYDTLATLEKLERLIRGQKAARVLALGDNFHRQGAGSKMHAHAREELETVTAQCEFLWISGNHDPDWGEYEEHRDNGFVFRHEAEPAHEGPDIEISGHFHPKISILHRGRRLRGKCFIEDDKRIILPAFGEYTGGLDITSSVFEEFLAPDFRIHICGQKLHSLRKQQIPIR